MFSSCFPCFLGSGEHDSFLNRRSFASRSNEEHFQITQFLQDCLSTPQYCLRGRGWSPALPCASVGVQPGCPAPGDLWALGGSCWFHKGQASSIPLPCTHLNLSCLHVGTPPWTNFQSTTCIVPGQEAVLFVPVRPGRLIRIYFILLVATPLCNVLLVQLMIQ